MIQILRCVLMLVVLCLASPAFADEYVDIMNHGTELFRAKDYVKARAEYERAYNLSKNPDALFSIAQTYRYEGKFKEAIEAYKRFLADSQAAQDLRTEAEAYLKESETRQKAIDDANKTVVVPPPPQETKPQETKPQETKPVGSSERKRRIPLGSKIAAGVTGVGLISALVFTKIGLDAEKDLKGNPNATEADANKVERDQNLINISWGVTGAAAITAVVIYFAAPSYATDQKNIAIAPNRDGGWSAAFTARF